MVFSVNLEVLGQFIDPTGEDRNLNLRRSGVVVAVLVLCNHFLLLFFRYHTFNFSFQTSFLGPIARFFVFTIFSDRALYRI